jgi:hypothetical protein
MILTKEYFDKAIEKLAISTARGFEEAKTNLKETEERLAVRIDHIEYGLIREHGNRIEKLEDNMRIVKTDLGMS